MAIIKANRNNISVIDNEVKTVKLISGLNSEELSALYKNNSWIKEECHKWALIDFDFLMEEAFLYLKDVKGLEYNMGYPGNYMCFSAYSNDNYEDFFEACIETQNKSICIFSDDVMAKIERGSKKTAFYKDCVCGYEDISAARFDQLEKWLKGIFEAAVNEIIEFYKSSEDYAYSDEAAEEAVEFWADNHGDDYYTDGTMIYETECRKYA